LKAASLFVLTVLLWAAAAAPTHIHMTWQSDPRTSITMSWATSLQTPGIVEYGKTTQYGMAQTCPAGKLHDVELTDLEPDTLYHYRVGDGSTWSGDYTFRTAPAAPNASFSFVAFGDSRTNWDIWHACSLAVLEADPDFCVHTGDLVQSGGDQGDWNNWFDEGRDLLSHKVLMPAIGNHEGNDPKYYQQFALPGNEDWYSFDYSNAHFTVLTTEKRMTGAQRDWLERDLSTTNATWKFVFFHRPMYSSGRHGCARDVFSAWGDLLDRYHVDMVFCGHDHIYERSYPMCRDWIAESPRTGTIHIVTGGAGAPLYDVKNRGPWSARALSLNHYVFLSVNGSELRMEARFLNHTAFDTLQISKARLPDLVIRSMRFEPSHPIPGEACTVFIGVENRGAAGSGPCSVRVELNGTVLEADVPDLEASSCADVSISWVPQAAGSYAVTAYVDPGLEVAEGIWEENNEYRTSVLASPRAPDLVPSALFFLGIPRTTGTVPVDVSINNDGTLPSGPFSVAVAVNGSETERTILPSLDPGGSATIRFNLSLQRGDWIVAVHVDPDDRVDEIAEANNVANRTVLVRLLRRVGAALLSNGFVPGERAVVYYNLSAGSLPANLSSVVACWGMNGWTIPPRPLAPPGVTTIRLFEAPMEKVGKDLWFISIPTYPDMKWIDLKFEDRPFLARLVDDNNGSFWIIPSAAWVETRMDELRSSIEEARDVGVTVSEFEDVLEDSLSMIREGRYLEAEASLSEAIERCLRSECQALLEQARSSYQEALAEALEVPVAASLLKAAEKQMEMGNYRSSIGFSQTVLRKVREAREALAEELPVFVASLTAICFGASAGQLTHSGPKGLSRAS